jgi:hypothetical protein
MQEQAAIFSPCTFTGFFPHPLQESHVRGIIKRKWLEEWVNFIAASELEGQ